MQTKGHATLSHKQVNITILMHLYHRKFYKLSYVTEKIWSICRHPGCGIQNLRALLVFWLRDPNVSKMVTPLLAGIALVILSFFSVLQYYI